jgi:hypothetical protein
VLQLQESIRTRDRDFKATLREKEDRISLLQSEVTTLKAALTKEKENGENLRLTLTQLHKRIKADEERMDEAAKKDVEIAELRKQNAELLENGGGHHTGTPLDPTSAQLATQVEIQRLRIRELEQQQTELLRTMAKLRNGESARKGSDATMKDALPLQTKAERPQTPPKVTARPVTPPQRIRSVSPLTRLSSSTPPSAKIGVAYRSSPSQIKHLVETAGFSQPTAASQGARPRLPSPVARPTVNHQAATVSIVIRPTMISAIRAETAPATAFPTTYRPTRLVRHHAWEDPKATKL